jgi:hypothetical protein
MLIGEVHTEDYFIKAKLAIERCEKRPEMKLEIEFEHVLKDYLEYLGYSNIEGQYEEHPGSGIEKLKVIRRKRQDATYGKVVIEYEHVGALLEKQGRRHSIDQLEQDYLPAYSEVELESMVGIAFDGKRIIFVTKNNNKWIEDEKEFNKHSFELFINYIIGLYRISFKQLPIEFGFHRDISRNAIKILYEKSKLQNPRVQMLFQEWNLRFSTIYGNAFNNEKINTYFKDLSRQIGIRDLEGNRLVFAVHTYYAFIVKLIAAEVAKNLFDSESNSHLNFLLETENIKTELQNIEEGKFFRGLGIENFIEGTFLSWYIDVWDRELENTLKQLIEKLDLFDFAEFKTRPDHVVDYLKNFYIGVFEKELRHDLGEFYTLDWIAEYIVNKSNFDGNIQIRLLDPACGSGTFLIAILNKIYIKNKNNPNKEELLSKIMKNVVGFDINPIAVLTARTNFLISLLRFSIPKGTLAIPVYLTDSIVLPEIEKQKTLLQKIELYRIKTTKGVFEIPREIKDNVAEVMQFIKENIERNQKPEQFNLLLANKFNFTQIIKESLYLLYNQLYILNSQNQNKIWCDIIVNQFAALFQKDFDFIIGNPPWVNWEFLDDDYQKHLVELNDAYGLYLTSGLESRLGKIRRDISSIFFYVCIDRYLKTGGKLAFLIKPMYQIPSANGFRNFNRIKDPYEKINRKQLGKNYKKQKRNKSVIERGISKLTTPIKILSVDDLTKENLFEINNEVSLIIAKKGEKTKYPVPYKIWLGNKTINEKLYKGEPSDSKDPLSTWIIYSGKKPTKYIGKFSYGIRTGIYFGLKDAFFDFDVLEDKGNNVRIKNSREIRDVEKDLIYPLLMSRHINRWKVGDRKGQPYTYCILPQQKPGEDNEQILKNKHPKTWDWLNLFRDKLLDRALYRKQFKGKAPFYSIFDLGDWDSKFKVVWCNMGYNPNFVVVSSVEDKILGKKLLLPEHVMSFIPSNNQQEANYICAILNSSLIRNVLSILSQKGKSALSGAIIKKIKLEKFNSKNNMHVNLASLSTTAHKLAKEGKESELKDIESQIDEIVKKLY